jgi:hypothetical protein
MINAPEGWVPEQVSQFQEWFDSKLAGNTANKTQLIWGPAGSQYQPFKEAPYKDDLDEWLARIVCFTFSLPPTAFVRQVNRATAESAQDVALEEGLAPLMAWAKRFVDSVIQNRMGQTDLEFAWLEQDEIDPKEQSAILVGYVKEGVYTRNEARDKLGLDPVEGGDDATVDTAQGPVLVKDLEQLSTITATPPPPPVAPMVAGSNNAANGGKPRVQGKPPAPSGKQPPPKGNAKQQNGKARTAKGAAKTLYVNRPLKNAGDLRAWAKAQGFTSTLDPEDMHVTVAFSRDPVDWNEIGDSFDEVRAGPNGRSVEQLGDKGAVALRFEAADLAKRWQQIRDAGASWDFPGYKPHLTISYSGAPDDLDSVEPYDGELVFGPERFAELDEDWNEKIVEVAVKGAIPFIADRLAKDSHVDPDNAEPLPFPLADPITAADVQHVSWALVRRGNVQLEQRTVPIADIIGTQAVVDRERVVENEEAYREHGQDLDRLPLVLEREGMPYLLAGHHAVAGMMRAGAAEVRVQVMTGEVDC